MIKCVFELIQILLLCEFLEDEEKGKDGDSEREVICFYGGKGMEWIMLCYV